LSATTSGALKALIEGLGLGISAYRDDAPAGTARPYVTILEELTLVADPSEDGKADTVVETVQVDCWQDWENKTTGARAESLALVPAIRRGIDGARLAVIGTSLVYTALVRHSLRQLEAAENLVHTSLTVEVYRQA
jgi:hypothetical protein